MTIDKIDVFRRFGRVGNIKYYLERRDLKNQVKPIEEEIKMEPQNYLLNYLKGLYGGLNKNGRL